MTMAKVVGLAMAMAMAGCQGKSVEVGPGGPGNRPGVVNVDSLKGPVPLYTPFWVGGKAPQAGHDYDDCKTNCDPVRYTVTFGKAGKKECPLKVSASVKNCLKDPDKDSCTAIKRERGIVFGSGDFPYQVRFSPFGEPLKVGMVDSPAQPIHRLAAVAWYKFTVDSIDPACKDVEAVDPNVIVTN